MNTFKQQINSADISHAIRYERVAILEAVLTLKQKQRRARLFTWTSVAAAAIIGAAFVIATA